MGFPIAFHISSDLAFPVFAVGGGHTRTIAPVPVPKTTVDEYSNLLAAKDNVGFAGKVNSVKPVSEARLVKQFAHLELWSRVPRFDACHRA